MRTLNELLHGNEVEKSFSNTELYKKAQRIRLGVLFYFVYDTKFIFYLYYRTVHVNMCSHYKHVPQVENL